MADEDAKDDIDVCMKEASSKRAYTLYTDQDKVRSFKLVFEKVMSASAATKQLGIHVAQLKDGLKCTKRILIVFL